MRSLAFDRQSFVSTIRFYTATDLLHLFDRLLKEVGRTLLAEHIAVTFDFIFFASHDAMLRERQSSVGDEQSVPTQRMKFAVLIYVVIFVKRSLAHTCKVGHQMPDAQR